MSARKTHVLLVRLEVAATSETPPEAQVEELRALGIRTMRGLYRRWSEASAAIGVGQKLSVSVDGTDRTPAVVWTAHDKEDP